MLAIDGGEKIREAPFPKRHLFTEEERQAVAALRKVGQAYLR